MNHKYIIVFDYETDSPDPTSCNPVEIAAVAIHPRTLEIKEDDAFKAVIKPPDINKDEYFTDARQKTIDWHANTRGCSSAEIIAGWKKGKSEKMVWKNFCAYLNKYKIEKDPSRKIYYTEPVPAGYNIDGFDLPICKRLQATHKTPWPFAKNSMDLYSLMYYWFEDMPEPMNLKMDTLKEFFGLKSHGQAHEAFSDVMDTAKILVRFLKFARKQSSVNKFKNSFAKVK